MRKEHRKHQKESREYNEEDKEEDEEHERLGFKMVGIVLVHLLALALFGACYGGVLCCFKNYQNAMT